MRLVASARRATWRGEEVADNLVRARRLVAEDAVAERWERDDVAARERAYRALCVLDRE